MAQVFKRASGTSERQWSAELEGRVLAITTGPVGGRQRTRRVEHATIESAASALNEAVDAMRASGWTAVLMVAEDVQSDDSPDDPLWMAVHADRLTEAGDLRGRLVLVQHALESRPDDVDLLAEQRELLLTVDELRGPLHEDVQLTWRQGYVSELVLPESVEAADELAVLSATGALRFLRKLTVCGASIDGVVVQLAAGAWPWLESLVLEARGPIQPALRDVVQRLPRLQRLDVQSEHADWSGTTHEGLGALHIRCSRLDAETLDRRAFPSLQELTVDVAAGWTSDRAALQRFTAGVGGCLRLGRGAAEEWLAGLEQRPGLQTLVLQAVSRPGEVAFWLEERQGLLVDVQLVIEAFELGDQTLARLKGLNLTLPWPDAAAPVRTDPTSTAQLSWRRFEKDQRSGRGFWSILREGDAVLVRHGRVGKAGREQRSELSSERAAGSEYERRVRRKVASGWEEV